MAILSFSVISIVVVIVTHLVGCKRVFIISCAFLVALSFCLTTPMVAVIIVDIN